MTAPATAASTAGHGLLRSFSARPSTAGLPAGRRGRLRNGASARRLPGRTPLRRPHPRRRLLPPAGHEQRPLPPAWRPEHGTAHRRRPRPLRPRPPHPRLLFGRDGRAAPRRHCPLPPHGCALRRAEGPAHRWAWAPSAESREPLRRQGPDLADQRTGRSTLPILCVSASPRWIFRRPRHPLRWAWGPSLRFRSPTRARAPPTCSPARPCAPRSPLGMGSFRRFRPSGQFQRE